MLLLAQRTPSRLVVMAAKRLMVLSNGPLAGLKSLAAVLVP